MDPCGTGLEAQEVRGQAPVQKTVDDHKGIQTEICNNYESPLTTKKRWDKIYISEEESVQNQYKEKHPQKDKLETKCTQNNQK